MKIEHSEKELKYFFFMMIRFVCGRWDGPRIKYMYVNAENLAA